MQEIPVGYKAIEGKLRLQVLPHYRESYIAQQGRGKKIINNGREIYIYPKSYALENEHDLLENLEFALRYDGINLEITKALFERTERNDIINHIQKQPTGIYSRKIWYLYEFLMSDQLPMKDCERLKYVDLLDSKVYFTNTAIKSPRHAINDNLLGNNKFCPFVRRTEILEEYIQSRLDNKARVLLNKYDPYLVMRACNYLYTKETMSSYQIEREEPDQSRIARFVGLLQQVSAIEHLSKEKLIELQNIIVDTRFKDMDYRSSQNYVGENVGFYFQKIHYISPKPEDVFSLMQGLLDALNRMLSNTEVHPVIIAATIAFGFVFIHPFEDGNGRIHRFLIHYILSKKFFTPKDMIFPVSAIMLQNMRDYDLALEAFSKHLLSVLTEYELTDDGAMTVKHDSKLHYQYVDFTAMAEYLFACIKKAVHDYIEGEIKFLVSYDKTKKAIQEIVDMPSSKIDLIIKFLAQNNGRLSSSKQSGFFSLLTDNEINQITEAYKHYYNNDDYRTS